MANHFTTEEAGNQNTTNGWRAQVTISHFPHSRRHLWEQELKEFENASIDFQKLNLVYTVCGYSRT